MFQVIGGSNPHQHTPEWWLARRGKITGSRMHVIMDGGARAWQTFADRLRMELLLEQQEEPDLDHVPAIAHGRKYEPVARASAELELGFDFELPGFRQHPQFDFMGCSADAYGRTAWHGPAAPVEIKCPLVYEKHMDVYRNQAMPAEHKPQVQCEIACYDAEAGLFISYHPAAPHWKMRTVIIVVPRDDAYIQRMYGRCNDFMTALREHRSPSAPAKTIPRLF